MSDNYSVLVQVLKNNDVLYRESVLGVPSVSAAIVITEKANEKMRIALEAEEDNRQEDGDG